MCVPVKLMQVGDASHGVNIDARVLGNLGDVSGFTALVIFRL
jgi:hypothetical protein